MLLASSRRRDGAGGGRGRGDAAGVGLGSGRVKIFHSVNKGPGGALRVGFFVTWLKGEPYKGCPAL